MKKLFYYFSSKTYFVVTQKICLNETVLLTTKRQMFKLMDVDMSKICLNETVLLTTKRQMFKLMDVDMS